METGRADYFTRSWDVTVRNTLQAILIGNIIGGNTGAFSVNQAYVQLRSNFYAYCMQHTDFIHRFNNCIIIRSNVKRLISCKSINHARGAAVLAIPWVATIIGLCLTSGYAMYSYFEVCDPNKAGLLSSTDQLMPYLTTWLFE